jgi:flavin reductase (DIM6/NTAB) family NADH-FMN oxidoreductase RutF
MTADPPPEAVPLDPAPVSVVEPRAYRNTIGLFATGVTVITTRAGDAVHGMTANAVTSVSLDPTLLLVCIDRRARMHGLIGRAGAFAVNILAEDQEALSGHFAGRGKEGPPPSSLRFIHGSGADEEGAPTIAGCVAALCCVVEQSYEGGDHTIVLGRVTELRPGRPGAPPLLWFGGRYRRLAGPDPVAHVAPDPWTNDAVQSYYPEWEEPSEPDDAV